jgi:hypothetical protein
MESKPVRNTYAAAHNRENTMFHRVWNIIFSLGEVELLFPLVLAALHFCISRLIRLSQNIAAISLGIATVFSCYSPKTTNLNIYTVSPVPFLQEYVVNATSQDISAWNSSASGLPSVYYFGISGNLAHSFASFNICLYYVFSEGLFCMVAL